MASFWRIKPMKKIKKIITCEILSFQELTTIEKRLIERAVLVRHNAQSPYSHFWVGCSIVTDPKNFSDGCNVENANWSETVHAEENAISNAISKYGPCRIKAVAIVGAPEEQEVAWPPTKQLSSPAKSKIKNIGDICSPCGHCLQVIAENCFDQKGLFDPTVPILSYNRVNGLTYRTTIGDAYPMPFLPQHLGVNYAKDPRIKKYK